MRQRHRRSRRGPLFAGGSRNGSGDSRAYEGGSGAHYGAMGEVVGIAAALQAVWVSFGAVSTTRRAVDDLFEWGETEEVFATRFPARRG